MSGQPRVVRIRSYPKDTGIELVLHGGAGWMTYIGPQGGRLSTLALDARACRELAHALVQLADAIEAGR